MKLDKEIFRRYQNGTATPEEEQLINQWYAQLGNSEEISDDKVLNIVDKIDARLSQSGILDLEQKRKILRLPKWSIVAAAASVILVIGFFLLKMDAINPTPKQLADVAAPSSSNSVIILENNTAYDLDNLKTNDTLNGEGYFITRSTSGEIVYSAIDKENKTIYNTVRTNAGGISSLILSDGSKVWLNAKSELRYPINFGNQNREVALQGEAYFEIEKDVNKPFFIRSNNHTIKVLGTKFNVQNLEHGYVSTLLEGKIAITDTKTELGETSNLNFPILLQPYQAYDGQQVTDEPDAYKVLDWKEGYFDFSDMTLEQACKKMEPWYNVSFVISSALKNKRIYGQISKNKSLRQVLILIEKIQPISYEINGNEVTIK